MKDIEALIEQFFKLLQVSIDELSVIEEENGIYKIILKTPDSGIVIGPHGKNMNLLSNILKLLLSKQHGNRVKVHFEVNDYGKQKQEKFLAFIKSKMNYVITSGKNIKLPFLTAYERKKVHSFIAENGSDAVFTKSIGEGNERRLFICKKMNTENSIDIDGTDI